MKSEVQTGVRKVMAAGELLGGYIKPGQDNLKVYIPKDRRESPIIGDIQLTPEEVEELGNPLDIEYMLIIKPKAQAF